MVQPTVDFADWTAPQGVNIQNNAVAALTGAYAGNGGNKTAQIPRVASLNINVTPPGLVAGARYILQVLWQDVGQTVWRDLFTYWDGVDGWDGSAALRFRCPARATGVVVQINGDNANTTTLNVTTSTAQFLAPDLRRSSGLISTRLTGQLSAPALGAGASSPALHLTPVTDRVALFVAAGDAHLVYTLSAVEKRVAGMVTVPILELVATPGAGQLVELHAPFLATQLVVTNTDVAAHDAAANVWDVS